MTIAKMMEDIQKKNEVLKKLLNKVTPPKKFDHLKLYNEAVRNTGSNIPVGYDSEGNSQNPCW